MIWGTCEYFIDFEKIQSVENHKDEKQDCVIVAKRHGTLKNAENTFQSFELKNASMSLTN